MGEPLTGMEAGLWARGTTWQVVSVCLLRETVTRSEVVAQLSDRIAYSPRWRRVVRPGLLGSQWIDDPDFDLGQHVRELVNFDFAGLPWAVADLLETPLPAGHPAWEAVVASSRGRTALIIRSAPALVDGYDSIHVLQESLDDGPAPIRSEPVAWHPEPEPQSDLAADAMAAVVRSVRNPRKIFSRAQAGIGIAAGGLSRTVLPQGQSRQMVGSTSFSLDRINQVRDRHHVTTHDVLVSLVAAGYCAWLRATGQPVEDKIAQIPLATSETDVLGSAIGSRIAPQWMALPLTVADPHDRLMSIASLTRARIDSGRLVPAQELESLAGFAPPTIAAVAAGTVAAGRPFDILISNIPGPATSKYFGPARLVGSHNLIGSPGPASLTATLTSFHGAVSLDVVVPSMPESFIAGTVEAIARLESI